MCGGELFIPKIPSYRIVDLANAIAPNCKHEIIGMRPGEKLHEEMITKTDAMNTVEFSNYFVILPTSMSLDINRLKEKNKSSNGKMCKIGFSYNSEFNKHFLSVDNLYLLIKDQFNL